MTNNTDIAAKKDAKLVSELDMSTKQALSTSRAWIALPRLEDFVIEDDISSVCCLNKHNLCVK